MVKGVSKNVIEIVDTGSEMFERAILFMRPHSREFDKDNIDEMARGFLGDLRLRRRWFPRSRSWWETLLKYGIAIGFGAMLAILILRGFY